MFVVHTFKRTLQWLVHSRLSPQFSGNGVQLFLSPDEAGSIIENRDGENLRQTQIATKSLRLSCPIVKQERQTRLNNLWDAFYINSDRKLKNSVLHLYSVTGDEIMATYVSDAS